MTHLQPSPVIFDEPSHTYTDPSTGCVLSGVTPIVAWLFADTYTGIPQAVLDRAAERGGFIHSRCRMADNLCLDEVDGCPEAAAYRRLCREAGLRPLANEYLVSDTARGIASSIDVVFDNLALCDIKTTSALHTPNVTLQLSIYALLFERQNPRLPPVSGLWAAWIPKPQYGQPRLVPLKRLGAEAVEEILDAYLAGGDPAPLRRRHFPESLPAAADAAENAAPVPAAVRDAESRIAELEAVLKAAKAQKEQLQQVLLRLMKQYGVKRWDTGATLITYVPPSTRKSLDGTRLKAERPDIYEQFLTETPTKDSVRIKVRE